MQFKISKRKSTKVDKRIGIEILIFAIALALVPLAAALFIAGFMVFSAFLILRDDEEENLDENAIENG